MKKTITTLCILGAFLTAASAQTSDHPGWLRTPKLEPPTFDSSRPRDEQSLPKATTGFAGTDLAIEDAHLKRIQREKLEGRLADVDEVITKMAELAEMIEAVIRQSPLEDDRKADIYSAIRQKAKEWSGG